MRVTKGLFSVGLMTFLGLGLVGCTDSSPAADAATTPALDEPSSESATTLTVQKSVFQFTYRLDGTIASSAAVGIEVPTGTQLRADIRSGADVDKGQRLGSLRAQSGGGEGAGDGTVAQSRRELVAARLGVVTAAVSGQAEFSGGSPRIESPGLDVVVPLKPLQELRYRGLDLTGRATVETVLGQRESACVAVWVEQNPTSETFVSDEDEEAGGSSAVVRCRLAADLETAAGLPAVLALTSQRQDNVIAVPLIYIGLDETGENYSVRVQQGTSVVDRPVVVSSTDGVRRVVTEGLAVGDVLVPVDQS